MGLDCRGVLHFLALKIKHHRFDGDVLPGNALSIAAPAVP